MISCACRLSKEKKTKVRIIQNRDKIHNRFFKFSFELQMTYNSVSVLGVRSREYSYTVHSDQRAKSGNQSVTGLYFQHQDQFPKEEDEDGSLLLKTKYLRKLQLGSRRGRAGSSPARRRPSRDDAISLRCWTPRPLKAVAAGSQQPRLPEAHFVTSS